MDNKSDLTEEQIRNWLQEHPDFFSHNPEILPAAISASGKVLSLEAGQLNQLRKKNEQLQERIDGMLERIRRNEEIYQSFHTISVRLITAPDPLALMNAAVANLEEMFHIHRVSVTLSDRSDGFANLFGNPREQADLKERLFIRKHADLARVFGNSSKASIRIGMEVGDRDLFFGPTQEGIRSEALVPLLADSPEENIPEGCTNEPKLMGSLNLGGTTPTRFLPSDSTDLLSDLATVFSHCLKKERSLR
ncbi:MAG: DUF484 family protein [Magnetococcales bacterium]|nr:DUF484 family protein [Magnetococcales bacterium]